MVKHFSLDLFCSTAILTLAAFALDELSAKWILAWGLACGVSPWLSFAAVFSFAATTIVLGYRALRSRVLRPHPDPLLRQGEGLSRLAFVFANILILISLLMLYSPVMAQRSGGVLRFWTAAQGFPDLGSPSEFALWSAEAPVRMVSYFWRAPGLLLFAIGAVGAFSFWNRNKNAELAMLLLAPASALVAAWFRFWPFGANEHMSFAGPVIFILLGEGSESIRSWISQRRRWLGEVALAALLAPTIVSSAWRVAVPRHNRELRGIFEFVQRHQQPGDSFVVTDPATAEFYSGHSFRRDASSEISPGARVWLITIPLPDITPGAREERAMAERLRATRPTIAHDEERGAEAWLLGPERAKR
jgi:hypothetical protein